MLGDLAHLQWILISHIRCGIILDFFGYPIQDFYLGRQDNVANDLVLRFGIQN